MDGRVGHDRPRTSPTSTALNYIELVEKGRKLAGVFLVVVGSVGDELDNKGQNGRDE